MYFLTPMCFICLHSKSNLDFVNTEMLSKLLYCTEKTEDFVALVSDRIKICKDCLDKLNVAFHFKKMCLSNIAQFIDYIDQLERVSKNCNVIKVRLIDIKGQKGKDELIDLSTEQYSDEEITIKEENLDLSLSYGSNNLERFFKEKQTQTEKLGNEFTKSNFTNVDLINYNHEEMQTNEFIDLSIEQDSDEQFETVFVKEEMLEVICEEEPSSQLKLILESNEQPCSCYNCEKFTNDGALTAHMLSHPENIQHSCSICGSSFKVKSFLTRHMLSHSDQRPFSCTICGRSFKVKSNLNQHMERHSIQQTHSCSICGKAFNAKGNLQQHIRYFHSDERPHSCLICGNGFKQKSDLNRHMLTHSDERSHSCSICGKSFKAKYNLTQHMQWHSDQRPHSCSICDSSFPSRNYLKKHMLRHSDERSHACLICGNLFKRKHSLQKHMLLHGISQVQACI